MYLTKQKRTKLITEMPTFEISKLSSLMISYVFGMPQHSSVELKKSQNIDAIWKKANFNLKFLRKINYQNHKLLLNDFYDICKNSTIVIKH